jgi:hypothetical protein
VESELRDWYLSTLGIVQYRTRAKSPVQNLSGTELVEVERKANPARKDNLVRKDNSASVPSSLRDLLEPSKDKQERGEPGPAPVVQIPVPKVEEEDTVSFRLACWRPSEDLLVIDSWPMGQDSDNRLSQLLVNILKSIQRRPDTSVQPEFIDWPLGDERSLSAARDHLAMFVQGRYEQKPFKWLLAMGEDVRRCLSSDESKSKSELEPGPEFPNLPLDCGAEAIFTHSLSEILARPECKKDVWANIRFLYS